MADGVEPKLQWVSRRLKLLGTISASIIAAATFVAANADLAPAHRGFVKSQFAELVEDKINRQIDTKFKLIEDRVGRAETRQSSAQLQINTLRRDSLEKEKFDLGLRLKTADDSTRALIEQRMRQITDDLNDVQQERTQIRIQP